MWKNKKKQLEHVRNHLGKSGGIAIRELYGREYFRKLAKKSVKVRQGRQKLTKEIN